MARIPTGPARRRRGALRLAARLGPGVLLSAAAVAASELRVARSRQPPTDSWRGIAIEPRGTTQLGLSFRPRQAEAFGLDPRACLARLLDYPFEVLRVSAYWDRVEPEPAAFRTDEVDWQLELAARAGRSVVLGVGAVKSFGYPELFIPSHRLPRPLPEGRLITPSSHPELLAAAVAHVRKLVEHCRTRAGIVAWQVEHEAVDPLGMEHSWRLSSAFVAAEVGAVRQADPSRPVLLNGFLPTSLAVAIPQRWRTRDQGDSVEVATRLADIVGLDHYPCHALLARGSRSLYLDGAERPWQRRRRLSTLRRIRAAGRRLMVTEAQAEPWEAVTLPPSPATHRMASCPPERLLTTYNQWVRDARAAGSALDAYLLWGAEYWVMRADAGDSGYLDAFARLLELA